MEIFLNIITFNNLYKTESSNINNKVKIKFLPSNLIIEYIEQNSITIENTKSKKITCTTEKPS